MLKNNKLKAVKQVLKFEYHLVKKEHKKDEKTSCRLRSFPRCLL